MQIRRSDRRGGGVLGSAVKFKQKKQSVHKAVNLVNLA